MTRQTPHVSRRTLLTGAIAIPVTAATATVALPTPAAHAFGAIGRQDVLDRARHRISLNLPYNSDPPGYTDGYRQDCSGFAAYAWGAPTPATEHPRWNHTAHSKSPGTTCNPGTPSTTPTPEQPDT